MTSELFTNVRTGMLGLTGLVCLAYGAAALAMGTPQPFAFWVPGLFGVASSVLIAIAAFAAGNANARRATARAPAPPTASGGQQESVL